MLDKYKLQRLITILKNYKYYQEKEDLPACFRDDEEVDEFIKIFKEEVNNICQKIQQLQSQTSIQNKSTTD